MKKINEIVLEFINNNLKNPQDIIFLGSFGQGSYSGATAYQGAFFLKSDLKSYQAKDLPIPDENGGFAELDGKHSYVEGSPEQITFKNLADAFQWYLENDVYLEYYQDILAEQYKFIVKDGSLVLQDEEENEAIHEVSPVLLSSHIWAESGHHNGVFTELGKKFKLITTLVPKEDAE